MAWRRIGDKPLSEPMLIRFTDAYMRHQGRWVNGYIGKISFFYYYYTAFDTEIRYLKYVYLYIYIGFELFINSSTKRDFLYIKKLKINVDHGKCVILIVNISYFYKYLCCKALDWRYFPLLSDGTEPSSEPMLTYRKRIQLHSPKTNFISSAQDTNS